MSVLPFSSRPPGEEATVDGALLLRDWALAALAAPGPPPPLPPASVASWELFLRVERVAVPLAGPLGAGAPTAAHAEVLRRHVASETRRILSARAMLHRIGVIARQRQLRVALLKGAVPVLRGGGPDLSDVDVFASPTDAAALAEVLDGTGYAATGVPGAHALRLRAAADSIPVEIHTSVPGSRVSPDGRLQPAPGLSGVSVLSPADHLWYVLHHATEQHSERRGALRDLLVLADALNACTAADRDQVERWVAEHWRPELLRAVLEMAEALPRRAGAPMDRFRIDAAGRFIHVLWMARAPRAGLLRMVFARSIIAAVAQRSGFPSDLGSTTLEMPSGYPLLAWMRSRLPSAERLTRLAIRRWPEWAAYPLGAAVARAAARAVDRTRSRLATG